MDYLCRSTLVPIKSAGYSPTAQRKLAGGERKFPFQLEFNRKDVITFRSKTIEHMSISGVQDKVSLKLYRGRLLPTERDGEYILKPIPAVALPEFLMDVPANEHLTMQLAGQLFSIPTPPNALVQFNDGEPAYLVKRFDGKADGTKIAQEDFCQLSNRSPDTGTNYKYEGSYEEIGRLLKRYCAAYAIEVEKLFALVCFNYVFSNGDAHLKNFSLLQTAHGDYVLTPAYDLLSTSLHLPNESRTALEMFDNFEGESFKANAFYRRPDFVELAKRYGIVSARAERMLDAFQEKAQLAEEMISRSFLSRTGKQAYADRFKDRLHAIEAAH
ncbi:type II toxin-antitoxin system HipA family toxin [Pontiella sulfatireligans]|uniref:HipA-like C-terminal domain-containing protein n=1 Tax=Pontiella sulfatireligans TaxID=2750658 RepID=A0A6C2UNZ6_9BACT|nr:HipA domain-containing protein [Pontiella sulfatireligans]VGO21047.1 hypothetical protein SCARR_03116 [Pontiella sulfatireligans]